MVMRPKRARPITCGAAPARPVRIEQRVVFVGVAVRPAIDGDGGDVARRIEAAGAEHAGELVADVALEGLERGREQFAPARRGAARAPAGPACTGVRTMCTSIGSSGDRAAAIAADVDRRDSSASDEK